MLTLLLAVIICGIFAWVLYAIPMPQPFQTIGIAILVLIVVIIFFDRILGVNTGLPIR